MNTALYFYLIITQQSQMLQPYSNHKMSHPTLLYVCTLVEVCACSSSVISLSVWLLFGHHVTCSTKDIQYLYQFEKFVFFSVSEDQDFLFVVDLQ